MNSVLQDIILRRPFSPYRLAGLEAAYDFTDLATLKVDASNRVSFAADKSPNSTAMGLVLPGTAGNYASFTALTAFGAGDFTVSARAFLTAFAANQALLGAGTNGFVLAVNTSANPYTIKENVTVNTASSGTLVAQTERTITYVRSGTTGTYYIDGVSAGSITDSNNYSVGSALIGASDTATPNKFFGGMIRAVRVYSVALNAAGVLADAGGVVQSNCTFDVDFTAQARGAVSFTSGTRGGATGITITVNASGDIGTRICGARDLAMLTGSKQPLLLPWSGQNYLYSPGVAGNYATTPGAAPLRITGDIDIRCQLSLVSWTPATNQMIVARADSNGQSAYDFWMNLTTGTLVFRYTNTGLTAGLKTATSSVATGFAANSTNWIRVTYATASGNAIFYTSQDGVNWTQLGTTQTITAGTIFPGTDILNIGANTAGAANMVLGNIYRAQIFNGIAGTLVANFDANQAANNATSWSSSTGETWTVNQSGAKPAQIVGGQSMLFDGTSYFLQTAPFTLNQPASVIVVLKANTWTSTAGLFDGSGTTTWLEQRTATPDFRARSPANSGADMASLALGTLGVVQARFNGATSSLRLNRLTGTADSLETTAPGGFQIGRGAGVVSNIQATRVLIFSTALNTATLDKIAQWAGKLDGITV